MLYVHCGWPRTGTSSFQAVLAERGDRLAEVDVVYPDGWRPRNSDAHYGIAELLEPPASKSAAAIDGFLEYFSSNADRTLLISSEALSNWLPSGKRESLVGMLLALRDVTEVTCLWTLRRLDRWVTSMYLHLIETGRPVPPPAEYFLDWTSRVADVLAGMCEVSDALGGGAVYFRYGEAGAHCGEILRTVGVPDPLRSEFEASLRDGPRRNRRLSQKTAVALLHADALSTRANNGLSPERFRGALRRGGFEFTGDAPCELVETEVGRTVHKAALEAARQVGFEPYVEFFEAEEVEPSSPVSLEPSVITDEDLSRLVADLEQRR
jgi:hypothetical protein